MLVKVLLDMRALDRVPKAQKEREQATSRRIGQKSSLPAEVVVGMTFVRASQAAW